MQHQAAGLLGALTGLAVNRIADERSALVMKVDADLMGAAGVEVTQDQGGERGGVSSENFVVRDRRFAAGRIDDGHFLAVHRVAADVGENGVLFRLRHALGDGQVEFFHRAALGELGDERLVGEVGFRNNEAAGGVLVEAVDDAGPLDAADAGELAVAVMEQGVDQRAIGISRCRVDDHAGGLVEDDEIFILKQNIQRDVLRRVVERNRFREHDADAVAEFHRVTGLGGMTIDLDELLANERLDARAGKVIETGGEKRVQTFSGALFDLDFHGGSLSGKKPAASFKFAGKCHVDTVLPMPESCETIAHCPSCKNPMNVAAVAPFSNVDCPTCGAQSRVKVNFGPYTLVRRHALGGMSMVFVAHDPTLDREVALKILSEDFSADERRIAAFEEEARITASFSHPNVVRVLTTGKAFGRLYIAMELVPGGHFEHQIRERGKIPQEEMLPLAIEVAEGLRAAHAAGLIHRDVKPGNILLDAEGHAKIVDFGLALVTQGGKAQAKEIWATPYYVPPETIEGHPEDFRSDIYAFGATLYHALAGVPSFPGETMSTPVLREAKKKIVPLGLAEPSLSEELCQIVDQAMAYSPADRFSSYDELIRRLESVLKQLQTGGAGAMESSGKAARRRARKKRREALTLGLAGFVVLAATSAGIWWVIRTDNPAPEPKNSALTAAPVESPPPPVQATDITKIYREARAAMEAREFARAAEEFVKLRDNPDVQEPTRTWAGLEAVAAAFLDGNTPEAIQIAKASAKHAAAVEEAHRIDAELIDVLNRLPRLAPLSAATPGTHLMASMISGLKNWEQGLIDSATEHFSAVVSSGIRPEDDWMKIYQILAADYLADAEALSSDVFSGFPASPEGCEAAITELDGLQSRLKTRGRARFNVRAWQLDLKRHAKVLEARQAAPATGSDWDPAAVLAKLADFAQSGRFTEASAYLKELPSDDDARSSLLAVTEAASVFLSDLEQDLRQASATGEFLMKSGENVSKVAMDEAGLILVNAPGGSLRAVEWADFSPDALIALHRIFVRNPSSESERLRRHECAISYDWLAGNRERALAAAAVLSQGSSTFKQRWESIASGLPE
jgi:eukaryotic-like serine/threonine-protein kinase